MTTPPRCGAVVGLFYKRKVTFRSPTSKTKRKKKNRGVVVQKGKLMKLAKD